MALSAPTDPAPGLSFERLTPTASLYRAVEAHGGRIAAVTGRPVAVPAPNTHLLLEASTGVPWAGGLPPYGGPQTRADTNRKNVKHR